MWWRVLPQTTVVVLVNQLLEGVLFHEESFLVICLQRKCMSVCTSDYNRPSVRALNSTLSSLEQFVWSCVTALVCLSVSQTALVRLAIRQTALVRLAMSQAALFCLAWCKDTLTTGQESKTWEHYRRCASSIPVILTISLNLFISSAELRGNLSSQLSEVHYVSLNVSSLVELLFIRQLLRW